MPLLLVASRTGEASAEAHNGIRPSLQPCDSQKDLQKWAAWNARTASSKDLAYPFVGLGRAERPVDWWSGLVYALVWRKIVLGEWSLIWYDSCFMITRLQDTVKGLVGRTCPSTRRTISIAILVLCRRTRCSSLVRPSCVRPVQPQWVVQRMEVYNEDSGLFKHLHGKCLDVSGLHRRIAGCPCKGTSHVP